MSSQIWNAAVYKRNARYVSELGMPVVDLLEPQPGERILDLGCGDGVLTKQLEEMGCELVGVDSSPELAQAAIESGLDVIVMDAAQMQFREEFDAVFSNAVLHWIKDADRLIQRVWEALRPGGRFVAECGGHRCVESIHNALVVELDKRGYDGRAASPWYFPTAQEYEARLTRAGFDVPYIEVIPRPSRLPGDMSDFLETFAGSFTSVLPPAARRAYVEDVCDRLKGLLRTEDGTWTADYTRLRFKAFKSQSPELAIAGSP